MPRVFAPSPLAGEGQDGGRSRLPLQIDDNGDLILHTSGGDDAFVAKIVEEESLSVSTTSLAFGEVVVGSTKDLTFTVQNIGEDTLSGTLTEPAPPFSLVSGGESFNLEPGATQTVTVRFSPITDDEFNGTLIFSSTPCEPNPQPDSVVVAVSGVGRPEQEAVGMAYVVNRASNSVSVINTTTRQEARAPIKVGTTPITLALTPDESKVYVVNFSHNVSVINTATLQVTQTQ